MSYLKDISELAEATPFGEVTVSIKRHGNKTTSIIFHTFESQKFAHTADAAAAILQIIKDAEANRLSGEITFVVVMNEGKVSRLVQQGHQVTRYVDGQAK